MASCGCCMNEDHNIEEGGLKTGAGGGKRGGKSAKRAMPAQDNSGLGWLVGYIFINLVRLPTPTCRPTLTFTARCRCIAATPTTTLENAFLEDGFDSYC